MTRDLAWVHGAHLYALIAFVIVLVGLAFVFKGRVKRLMRLAKAAATDPRLPRPVRWLFMVSLAVKTLPVPDFGIDEVGLLLGIVLLNTVYKRQWTEIKNEIKWSTKVNPKR